MAMFRDFPDDELNLPNAGAEDEGSTEPEDEAPDAAANDEGGEANEDEEDDTGPVSRAKYDADMTAMRTMIQDLKSVVGRAQSLARQVGRDPSADVEAKLREQNLVVAELIGHIVEGIDESAIDPKLKARVLEARREIMAAEERARMMEELKSELGITPEVQREREELEDLQARANDLAETIEDQIVAAGLDPNDETLFPWKEWAQMFKEGRDERPVRRAALKAINDAMNADRSGDRRESRRGVGARVPSNKTPAAKKDPLLNGSLAERIAYLDRL